jgi:hypothetical protein
MRNPLKSDNSCAIDSESHHAMKSATPQMHHNERKLCTLLDIRATPAAYSAVVSLMTAFELIINLFGMPLIVLNGK